MSMKLLENSRIASGQTITLRSRKGELEVQKMVIPGRNGEVQRIRVGNMTINEMTETISKQKMESLFGRCPECNRIPTLGITSDSRELPPRTGFCTECCRTFNKEAANDR